MRRKGSGRSSRNASPCSKASDPPIPDGKDMGQARPVGGSGAGDPRGRTARITDLDALAGMWEELAKYPVEIGGPGELPAPRWEGEWEPFTRNPSRRPGRPHVLAEIAGR